MAQAGAKRVWGIDLSRQLIRAARRLYRASNLTFEVGPGIPQHLVRAGADIITAFEVIEHMHNPSDFLSGAARALRNGGLVLVSTPNGALTDRGWLSKNPFHHREYTPSELSSLLRAHFRSVQVFGVRRKQHLPPPEASAGSLRLKVSKAIWTIAGRKTVQPITRVILQTLPRYVAGYKMPWVVLPKEPWTEYEVSPQVSGAPGLLALCRNDE